MGRHKPRPRPQPRTPKGEQQLSQAAWAQVVRAIKQLAQTPKPA